MPQRFGLYEDLSVMENLRLYAALRGLVARKRDQALDRLLAFTRLGPFIPRLAGKLSGGMKQKLGLACALLATPQVLLLDNLASVSIRSAVRTSGTWSRPYGKGLAVIWATAYLDKAERCDTVLLLNEGELRIAGPPAALTRRIAKRSLRLRAPQGDRRSLFSQALNLPSVCDGVIQGDSVRLVLRKDQPPDEIPALVKAAGARVNAVTPRFGMALSICSAAGPAGLRRWPSAWRPRTSPWTARSSVAT